MRATRPLRSRGDLAVLFVLVATLIPYARVVSFDFVFWDDNMGTYANTLLNPPRWESLGYLWTHLRWNVYMPVTWTVWTLAAFVAYLPDAPPGVPALNPYVFHTVSLATHLCAVVGVYLILRRLRYDAWPACAGALVFALHPLQVESVAWISGYNVVLCSAFSLLAIHGYLRFAEAPRERRWGRYAWATLAFAAALLSKPMAVTVPFIVIAIDAFVLRRPLRRTIAALTPWLLASVALAVTTAGWQGTSAGESFPKWTRLLIAADAAGWYLRHLVWPVNFGIDHGRTPLVALADPGLMWKVLVPVVVAAALWLWRDRVRLAYAALLVGVAGLLPILGLAPFDFQQYSTVADRYAYLAMLGAALAAAWLASLLPAVRCRLVCLIVAALLGVLTSAQVSTWRNSHTLFARATGVNPRSTLSWMNWAAVLIDENEPVQAITRLRRALALYFDHHGVRLNLGTAYYNAGQIRAAERERSRLLVLYPQSLDAQLAQGDFYADTGRYVEAAAAYRAALQINPESEAAKRKLERLPPGAASAPATSRGASDLSLDRSAPNR